MVVSSPTKSCAVRLRRRVTPLLIALAGVFSTTLYGRTAAGAVGTAGRWPNATRRIAGVATQSSVPGSSYHQSGLALVNVTFARAYLTGRLAVTPRAPWPQHYALEPCARCAPSTGGATAFLAGAQFVDGAAGDEAAALAALAAAGAAAAGDLTDAGVPGGSVVARLVRRPALAFWSWPFQVGGWVTCAVRCGRCYAGCASLRKARSGCCPRIHGLVACTPREARRQG